MLCSPISGARLEIRQGEPFIYGRLAWVDEAAAELGVLHRFPETSVMQVGVLDERLGSPHCSPGKAALLGSVINLLRRQAGNEVGDKIIDYI